MINKPHKFSTYKARKTNKKNNLKYLNLNRQNRNFVSLVVSILQQSRVDLLLSLVTLGIEVEAELVAHWVLDRTPQLS